MSNLSRAPSEWKVTNSNDWTGFWNRENAAFHHFNFYFFFVLHFSVLKILTTFPIRFPRLILIQTAEFNALPKDFNVIDSQWEAFKSHSSLNWLSIVGIFQKCTKLLSLEKLSRYVFFSSFWLRNCFIATYQKTKWSHDEIKEKKWITSMFTCMELCCSNALISCLSTDNAFHVKSLFTLYHDWMKKKANKQICIFTYLFESIAMLIACNCVTVVQLFVFTFSTHFLSVATESIDILSFSTVQLFQKEQDENKQKNNNVRFTLIIFEILIYETNKHKICHFINFRQKSKPPKIVRTNILNQIIGGELWLFKIRWSCCQHV